MSFFSSIEFYVLLLFVAAAIVAAVAKPSRRGQARQHLLAGWLSEGEETAEPSLVVECGDDGTVTLTRLGLDGVWPTGAVSLAITQIGFDLDIIERTTPGAAVGTPVSQARFTLNFMASEWYHIKYVCDIDGRMAAFTLHVRPGIVVRQPLKL